MRTVGLKILKNKLSEYVRLAACGETVLVTNRDRVVAELVPPRKDRGPLLSDTLLAAVIHEGALTPPTRPMDGPPPRLPVASIRELLDELSLDREDG